MIQYDKVRDQSLYLHGLGFDCGPNNRRSQDELLHDVKSWCQEHLTEKNWIVAIHHNDPLTEVLTQAELPYMSLTPHGCPHDLRSLPIGTANVMAVNDPEDNWCTNYSFGAPNSFVWHDTCARVKACKLAAWWREDTTYLPTLHDVNEQRLLWQKRHDPLLDLILCNACEKEKDVAYSNGCGLEYQPNCDGKCKLAKYIMEQNVFCQEWKASIE